MFNPKQLDSYRLSSFCPLSKYYASQNFEIYIHYMHKTIVWAGSLCCHHIMRFVSGYAESQNIIFWLINVIICLAWNIQDSERVQVFPFVDIWYSNTTNITYLVKNTKTERIIKHVLNIIKPPPPPKTCDIALVFFLGFKKKMSNICNCTYDHHIRSCCFCLVHHNHVFPPSGTVAAGQLATNVCICIAMCGKFCFCPSLWFSHVTFKSLVTGNNIVIKNVAQFQQFIKR